MLKVRDNLDLKELEKFGFTRHEKHEDIYVKRGENYFMEIDSDTPWLGLDINKAHENQYDYCRVDDEFIELIFDLIEAGIIERITK